VALAVTTRLFDTCPELSICRDHRSNSRIFNSAGWTAQDVLSLPAAIRDQYYGQPLGTIPLSESLGRTGAPDGPRRQSLVPFPANICPVNISRRIPLSAQTALWPLGQNPAFPPRHRRGGRVDGLQALGSQSRLSMESIHLADRKSEISVQYAPIHPGGQHWLSLFRKVFLSSGTAPSHGPIAAHWNTVGRWVYSLQDRQTIEQVAVLSTKAAVTSPVGAAPLL